MAQRRDRLGRFASSGGVTYGNRSDRDSDKRAAKRETNKLNKEQKTLEAKITKLKASAPSAKVASAKAGLAGARAKKAEATAKLKASQGRMAELKAQLAASQARLGGKSATKRGARKCSPTAASSLTATTSQSGRRSIQTNRTRCSPRKVTR